MAIQPENKAQAECLEEMNKSYRALALWLAYRLLGRSDLHWEVHNVYYIQLKPRADLAVAGFNFCFQVFSRFQGNFVSAEELWGCCEYSLAKLELRSTGFWGDKPLNKDDGYRLNKKSLKAFEEYSDGKNVEMVIPIDPSEYFYGYLTKWAIRYAKEHGDKDLDFHTHQFIKAWKHYNDITRRSPVPMIRAKQEKPKRSRAKKPIVTKC
jgi:hypothetical protein